MSGPVVTQTKEGSLTTIKNRYGDTRTVRADREWKVEVDGEEVGRIRYRMITRERRGAGLRYVWARWQSPGWERCEAGERYWLECRSKKAGIESLVWLAARKKDER